MAEAWKTVRIFISSTFRDMQAERDHLVRFVFPRLREALLKRRIHLVDVDLRWGVTGDQDAFDLCMDEIDRCRPRFICMLGGRYGWVPAPKVIAKQSLESVISGNSAAGQLSEEELLCLRNTYVLDGSTNSYNLQERPSSGPEMDQWTFNCERAVEILQRARLSEAQLSITASEIHYGALDKPGEPIFRYFYFRDPAITASIPASHANDYREPAGSFAETALNDLKDKIKTMRGKVIQTGVSLSRQTGLVEPGHVVEAPLPVFEYSCRWDNVSSRIVGLREFGEKVYADIIESIDAEFGFTTGEPLEEFAEEAAAMEAFVETRVERYIVGSRQEIFDQLLEHTQATGGNGYLCVVGEPGSGKSAMLGRFYRDYMQAAHTAPQHDLVIPHFVGASAASTNARQVLRRFIYELAQGAGITQEIPDDYDQLRETFAKLIEQVGTKQRVVFLIDAINQMDANAHNLRWLPDQLPPTVRVMLTTLPGPALDALRARREPAIEIQLRALNESDATAIIEEFLSRYRKTFDQQQRHTLLRKQGAGTPLYLLTALEELRTLGTYEEITQRINELPEETRPLFLWILNRLENDDGFRNQQGERIGAEVVRRYCSYLAAGRSGMAQAELAQLVAPASPGEDSAPDALGNVAALQRLLRPYLMLRGELLDFFHGQLREAVEEKYLKTDEERAATHQALADYFQQKADPAGDASWKGDYPRGLSELPYHQTEAQRWEDVYKTLTDLDFLEAKCTQVAVSTTGSGAATRKMYGGVYELQDDYRRAIEKMPA